MSLAKSLQAAAGAGAAGEAVYIDDTFSTYLYTGNGSTQTITNGIDLAGEGGAVWIKSRDVARNHLLSCPTGTDSDYLVVNATDAKAYDPSRVSAFTSSGFSVGSSTGTNGNAEKYASWTFRKAAKFFDVVTYTGNGANYRAISHSLGSTPGMVIVKSTSASGAWAVWHRSVDPNNLILNSTSAAISGQYSIQDVTSANFAVANSSFYGFPQSIPVNNNGETYVAYLFAHDAGGFGADGSENVISCGSFTLASGITSVTLGWEPQYVLIKKTSGAADWKVSDNMLGLNADVGQKNGLLPNTSGAENVQGTVTLTSTGFRGTSESFGAGDNGTYIYIAIRRPMKPPESGTEVFEPVTRNTTGANATVNAVITPVDLAISQDRNAVDGQGALWFDRLRGATKFLRSAATDPEFTQADTLTSFAVQNGYTLGADAGQYGINSSPPKPVVYWNLRRAPGFFDVVCYKGTSSVQTVAHNLGVPPELIIAKNRTGRPPSDSQWQVYDKFNTATNYLILNQNVKSNAFSGAWNNTEPTSSVFTLGTLNWVNVSGEPNVAYLFATYPGVSKVGSYTGTGTTLQINCGFTGGARFVMIKRTDSTGDWYVWDSARGIVAGNDPYLLLNSNAAEVTGTDYIDTYSAGFEITSTAPAEINANGGTFIFLAIA